MTDITVVTPWKDCAELIPDYEKAISRLLDDDRCIVIDNGSSTDIVVEGAETIAVRNNLGFCRGNNLALHSVETDAVLFLNNDVRMISPNWVEEVRRWLQPGLLVGASLMFEETAQVPYLEGWCIAGMTEDIHSIGEWNTDFEEPAYMSDVELCWRARKAKMRLRQVNVGLLHLGNYSTRRQDVTAVANRNREVFACLRAS